MLRDLSLGSAGPDVKELQGLLNYHLRPPNIPLATDGQFGRLTDARVRQFQTVNQIHVDGIVGPETRSRLFATITVRLNTRVRLAKDQPIAVAARAARSSAFGGRVLLASAGDSLPAGAFPTASPSPSPTPTPHLHLDNFQVQAGGQRTFSPWIGPSSPSFDSLVVGAQATFLKVSDGPHLELAVGGQFALSPGLSDGKYNAQGFFQITGADLLAPGRFHLFSPFAQVAFQSNFFPLGSPTVGLTAGNQLSFDIIKDKWMFFVQGALATNISLNDGTVSVSPQVIGGMTVQFGF
jgi:Putative peptidoglycan binding domain